MYREEKHHAKGCGNHDEESGREHETNDDLASQGNPRSNDDLYNIRFGSWARLVESVYLTGIGTSIRMMSDEMLSTKPRINGVPSSKVHCSANGGSASKDAGMKMVKLVELTARIWIHLPVGVERSTVEEQKEADGGPRSQHIAHCKLDEPLLR